jgi:nucleoside-diphosphate-sugar epimerase
MFATDMQHYAFRRQSVHSIRGADNGFRLAKMFLLVTGGTGYVGSHTVAALTSAGHRVRVLARSPDGVAAALEPLGVAGVETSIGDVTDPVAVKDALDASPCRRGSSPPSVAPANVAQRHSRAQLPWSGEGIWVLNCAARCDDSKAPTELAFEPRPLRDTLADTIRWLVEVGRLTPTGKPISRSANKP